MTMQAYDIQVSTEKNIIIEHAAGCRYILGGFTRTRNDNIIGMAPY